MLEIYSQTIEAQWRNCRVKFLQLICWQKVFQYGCISESHMTWHIASRLYAKLPKL